MGDGTTVVRSGGGALAIGPVPSEEELLRAARAEDVCAARAFPSERRRREYLAWRALLYGLAGDTARVAYDASGAPLLPSHPHLHVSASHCADMAAVAVSRDVCGVDIERSDRDFSKAAPRFLAAEERALSDDPRLAAAVWCAKECLFKMYGRRGLDLLRDIRIRSVDFAAAAVSGEVSGSPLVRMKIIFPDDRHIAVYAL